MGNVSQTKKQNGILPFLLLAGAAVGGYFLLKNATSEDTTGSEDNYYGGSGSGESSLSGLNDILNQLPALTTTSTQPISVTVPSSSYDGSSLISGFLSAFSAKDSIDSGVDDNDSYGSNGFGLYDDGLNLSSTPFTTSYYSQEQVQTATSQGIASSLLTGQTGVTTTKAGGKVATSQAASTASTNTSNADQYTKSGALPYTIDSSWSAKESYYAKDGQSLYNASTGEAFAYSGTTLSALQSYKGHKASAETVAAKKAAMKAAISSDSGSSSS